MTDLTDDFWTRFHERRMDTARVLAKSHSLEELAAMVAARASRVEQPRANNALIPWTVIFAIRIKLGDLK